VPALAAVFTAPAAGAGTLAYTSTWCTTSRAPGMNSMAVTHLSSVKPVGISEYW
jgi:hypothetical protein